MISVIAIGRRARHGFGTDDRIAAGPVLDHYVLAEALRHPAGNGARQHVGAAARGERHQHLDRAVRPRLRERMPDVSMKASAATSASLYSIETFTESSCD
jgi:hypothetical protein